MTYEQLKEKYQAEWGDDPLVTIIEGNPLAIHPTLELYELMAKHFGYRRNWKGVTEAVKQHCGWSNSKANFYGTSAMVIDLYCVYLNRPLVSLDPLVFRG